MNELILNFEAHVLLSPSTSEIRMAQGNEEDEYRYLTRGVRAK